MLARPAVAARGTSCLLLRRNQLTLDPADQGPLLGLLGGQDLQRGQARREQLLALGRVRARGDELDHMAVGAQRLGRPALGQQPDRQVHPGQRRSGIEGDGLLRVLDAGGIVAHMEVGGTQIEQGEVVVPTVAQGLAEVGDR
jgi:hypothetical protein